MEALARAWHWLGFGGSPKALRDHSRFNFSPSLVPSLKGDHSELVKQHGELARLASEGRYTAIPAALAAFKSKFDLHILNENLHFYCYVEEKTTGRPDDADMIRGFRSEMNSIARAVVNFVKKYRSEGVGPQTAAEFLVELRQIGALLLKRIEREEKELYVLYRP
jgi:hypothetical protein